MPSVLLMAAINYYGGYEQLSWHAISFVDGCHQLLWWL
jgi:hypothetical protein